MTFEQILDSLVQNDGAGPGKPQVEQGVANLLKHVSIVGLQDGAYG